MNDDLIIYLIWGGEALEQKFETDPYSMTLEEIQLLEASKKRDLTTA